MTIEPLPNETQPEFAIRFHEAMKAAVPETDARDQRMMQTWRRSRGPSRLDTLAAERFGKDHEYHPGRPVFAEHTTEDANGNVVVYDRNALISILNRNNARIEDTGDFSPITEGHTPTRMQRINGVKPPPVLGYAGPYRLGMIGNKNPRWAIFEDEWHHKTDVEKLSKLRRRSPEVWLEERMEDRFFDPIAALGSEAPRLDTGMTLYAKREDGTPVEKYAATFPSADTVFVASGEEEEEKQYAADQPSDDISPEKAKKILDDGEVHGEPLTEKQRRMFQAAANKQDYQSGENDMAGTLGPEEVQQIVDALMNTEPLQWVVSQMEQSAPEPAAEPPANQPGMGGEMPENGNGTDNGATAVANGNGNGEGVREYMPDDDDRAAMNKYMAGEMDDKEYAEYMAGKRKSYMAGDNEHDDDDREDYSKRRQEERVEQARYAKVEKELEETRNRLAAIEQEKERTDRYSKLTELRQYHAFDIEKEMERCAPAKMTAEQFEDHLDVITENYEKIPVSGMMPRLHTEDDNRSDGVRRGQGGFTEEETRKAQRYALSEREKGNNVSWAEALEHVTGKNTKTA